MLRSLKYHLNVVLCFLAELPPSVSFVLYFISTTWLSILISSFDLPRFQPYLFAIGFAIWLLIQAKIWRNNYSKIQGTSYLLIWLAITPIIFPVVAQAIQIALNLESNYPGISYCVDQTYFMQFIHDFLHYDNYPPNFIASNIDGFKYHYGAMYGAAMVSKSFNIQPHIVFLIIMPLVFTITYYWIVVNIIKEAFDFEKSWQTIFTIVLVIYLSQIHIEPTTNIKGYLYKVLKPEFFGTDYPSMSTLLGKNIVVLALYAGINWDKKNYKFIGFLALITIGYFKLPYMPIILSGITLLSIYQIFARKQYNIILHLLLTYIISIVGIVIHCYSTTYSQVDANQTLLLQLGGVFTIHDVLKYTVLLILFLITYLYPLNRPNSFFQSLNPNLLAFFVPPLLVFSIINVQNADAYQLITQLPIVFCLIISPKITQNLNIKNIWGLILISPLVVISMFWPLVFGVKVLVNQTNGHEYTSNQLIAEALNKIPIENTLIATNDLRFPANNFTRDQRQFQISAIFGHKAFNTELHYSKMQYSKKEHKDRLEITKILQNEQADSAILSEQIKRNKITHLLIHEPYKKPKWIPFPKIWTNGTYSVYETIN